MTSAHHTKHMSTNATSTEATQSTNVVATATLCKSISEIVNAQLKLNDKFASTARIVAQDATDRGIDRKLAGLMLANAYTTTFTRNYPKATDKHDGETEGAYVTRMLAKTGPDRSKILTLAYPKNEAAAQEAEAGRKLGMGLNTQLELARGNTTVEEVIAAKAEKGAAKGARPPSGDVKPAIPAAKAQAEADAAKGLTPTERVQNYAAALKAYGAECGFTPEQTLEIVTDWFADSCASEASE